MDHKTVLNKLLADACPFELDVNGDPDVRTFIIETHCVSHKITARLVSTVDEIQYEILGMEYND